MGVAGRHPSRGMNFYHRKRTTQLTKLSIDLCCPIPPWYLVQHSCCDSVSGGLTSCMAHLFPLYLLSYKKKFKKFRSLLYLSFTRYLLNRIFQRKKQTGRRRRKREGSDYICAVLLLLYAVTAVSPFAAGEGSIARCGERVCPPPDLRSLDERRERSPK